MGALLLRQAAWTLQARQRSAMHNFTMKSWMMAVLMCSLLAEGHLASAFLMYKPAMTGFGRVKSEGPLRKVDTAGRTYPPEDSTRTSDWQGVLKVPGKKRSAMSPQLMDWPSYPDNNF
ncbi:hypothetical protein BV898_18068 [Hypsibius exemplaris]|uniref:Uncharacterized protein n=1 Tax=Hypsibius exemplaris TaxID=2072580 RepID=A0A9X6RN52_HYPEX|nr:hypothetical protein BV898_18068 [Hypsibius exemplaris]